MICFEAPSPGYAVLWSVGVDAAGAPVAIRKVSRFIASVVVVDKAQTADGLPRERWPSVNIPRQVGSTTQIQFKRSSKYDSIFGLFCQKWIESNFPRPKMEIPFWLFIFLPIRSKFQSNPIQKVELGPFFFFVKTGPK